MNTLYAQSYAICATGLYFARATRFDTKVAKPLNAMASRSDIKFW